ncbi:extracellular solute-binding protein [Corynebacterium sp. CCUG 69979]|uniref:extracellular solute-binding protein n=1 Tax=Corynebacterium sp. CCUG 69979 TaxID=2823890 RepID=UPI00210A755B|nr:extracellular solute-binding protein [Corynebacterium sp. CCUG 69979]MCQ4624697.1 extracellular solute-binding protein [Corynebacterium sp. CCUG 69979]
MKKLLATLAALLAGTALVACSDDNGGGGGGFGGFGGGSKGPLTIVAATELQDLEPLVQQASEDLGFDITLQFPDGTLQNSQELKAGNFDGQMDATWFATNRYVNLIDAQGKLADETKIATSPVAFGVQRDKAQELGWDTKQPTWSGFADAAREGKFSFGMTDPSTSNSGFSALVSVATAMADTGSALTQEDIQKVGTRLTELFQAQSLVSGSSSWLKDAFLESPERADAIINYESTLHAMRNEGANIEVIVPADGVISADYPLSTLAQPKNENAAEQVRQLAEWLLEHEEQIADSYRRPVTNADLMPAEMSNQTVIELAFPASYGTVEALLDRYNNDYRQRGTATFVLDTSGSMEGERIASLQQIMTSLIDGSAATATGDVALRDGELVTFQSFSTAPHEPLLGEFLRDDRITKAKYQGYVNDLVADGQTAIYDTLFDALRSSDPNAGISSIVLLSDGEVTHGMDYYAFEKQYQGLSPEQRSIPVFVILYGEANASEMNNLAELTGGAVFDALNGDLDAAFKEIRGYQ